VKVTKNFPTQPINKNVQRPKSTLQDSFSPLSPSSSCICSTQVTSPGNVRASVTPSSRILTAKASLKLRNQKRTKEQRQVENKKRKKEHRQVENKERKKNTDK